MLLNTLRARRENNVIYACCAAIGVVYFAHQHHILFFARMLETAPCHATLRLRHEDMLMLYIHIHT